MDLWRDLRSHGGKGLYPHMWLQGGVQPHEPQQQNNAMFTYSSIISEKAVSRFAISLLF